MLYYYNFNPLFSLRYSWYLFLNNSVLACSCGLVSHHLGNIALKGVEDGEGKTDVSNHTHDTRSHSFVETHDSISSQDLFGTVNGTVVLVSIHALHLSFDDVNRVVSHS